jgi:DNA-binding protein H-NS
MQAAAATPVLAISIVVNGRREVNRPVRYARISSYQPSISMTNPNELNLEKLDYATLKRLLDDVSTQIAAKRDNELKTLVNGWAQKAALNGLTVAEVIAEFETYLPKKGGAAPRAAASPAAKGPKPYKVGVVYRNPNGSESWTGGTKGRQPPWLRELVPETLSHEERVRKFADLAV